ncbi:hypothetical protein PAHAL_2G236900 [Panicum hallii]|uniref:Uncharacterized protein n=1 Tax=Panicum hallii TaxID=206008 RepID=A0A2T8KQ93_9POAL|nr:hypothetical protein PAHAL_2G236900 [Panicum hallii]
MPANSSLPTRLPMCFPSRSRQFSERAPRKGAPVVPRISFQRVLGNQHRLPSFQCYRDPPSLQPARGIPSSAAATPFRPSTGQIPFVISVSSASCCIPSPTLSLESKLLLPIDCRWLLDPLPG